MNPAIHAHRFEHGADDPSGRPAGVPLVLLHGWGLNRRVFDDLGARLSTRRDVVAVDLPGHGQSAPMPWEYFCAELLAALPDPIDLLGWSLGGQLALELAHLAPQSVRRLVLIATTPKFLASPDWPAAMQPAVLEAFAIQLGQDYRRTVTEFLELQVRGSQHADAQLLALRTALLAHGEASPAALQLGLDWLRTRDLREKVRSLAQPTLALAGQYDRVTPSAASRALAHAMPIARFAELRRAGHAPFLSHLTECVGEIECWLDAPTPG